VRASIISQLNFQRPSPNRFVWIKARRRNSTILAAWLLSSVSSTRLSTADKIRPIRNNIGFATELTPKKTFIAIASGGLALAAWPR
jgi:hypothetical protein